MNCGGRPHARACGLGFPVFSDGASGWAQLGGPTGGYLVGFVAAAMGVGQCANRWQLLRIGPALAAMLAAHVLILAFGWSWLARSLGAAEAFEQGVAPFLVGGVVKSAIAVVIVVPLGRTRHPAVDPR